MNQNDNTHKSFSVNLLEEYQRPITKIDGINALIDTGAIIPTFSMPAPAVESLYGARKILDSANITGFGGSCHGKVYEMDSFAFGDMKFEPFQFFVPDNNEIKQPILLSATMFYGTEYDIDTINNNFTVRVNDEKDLTKSFKIKDLNGQLLAQVNDVLLQDAGMGIQEYGNYAQSLGVASMPMDQTKLKAIAALNKLKESTKQLSAKITHALTTMKHSQQRIETLAQEEIKQQHSMTIGR